MTKQAFAEILYLSGTARFFNFEPGTIAEEVRSLLTGRPAPTPDEVKALILDFVASKLKAVLITKCEELNINERRFDDFVPVFAMLGREEFKHVLKQTTTINLETGNLELKPLESA